MKAINILPQKIYEFNCDPDILKDVQSKILNLEWSNNAYNSISKDGYLHKNKLFEKLHEWFHNCLLEVKNDLQFQATDIKIIQSWAIKTEKEQFHGSHRHPNSVLSGIFYLTPYNVGTTFLMKSIWQTYDANNESNGQPLYYWGPPNKEFIEDTVKEEPGKLIIFPSILEHGVKPTKIEETRYTIAFNSFICGKIGHYGMYNELIIDIK